MNLAELRKLAESMHLVACSPERFIAMLDVIAAADAMRKLLHTGGGSRYDRLRAKLEEL
jgi:hypothetical protein